MPIIRELKIFKVFVSMATKLPNRQRFYKNTVISKQITCILPLQREIWVIYAHFRKSTSVKQM